MSRDLSQLWEGTRQHLVHFYKNWANRLYNYRWYFVVFSLAMVGSLFLVLLLSSQSGGKPPQFLGVMALVCMSATAWIWGLACLCFWFHPEHGTLFKKWRIDEYVPTSPEGAAVFLTIWLVVIPIGSVFHAVRMLLRLILGHSSV